MKHSSQYFNSHQCIINRVEQLLNNKIKYADHIIEEYLKIFSKGEPLGLWDASRNTYIQLDECDRSLFAVMLIGCDGEAAYRMTHKERLTYFYLFNGHRNSKSSSTKVTI